MPLDAEDRAERALWLRLILTPGIGPGAVRDLLAAFGLPEDIYAAGRARISAVLDSARATALLGSDEERERRIAAALDWAAGDSHHLVTLADPRYPARLLQIGDPPPVLYVRGNPAALARDTLAIVGSRHATRGGMANAEDFARALADLGLHIVSGLALGIDAAAHRGGLEGRAGTSAVVGTGPDLVYPPSHRALADAIARDGALVSELPPGTAAVRSNFPRRNRLIAGLSLGVLVVEAARQSGSLITARQAGEFGREVMAIPGSIHSPVARGCHRLIREGAKLVESAEDVLAELRNLMTSRRTAPRGMAEPTEPAGPHLSHDARRSALGSDARRPALGPAAGSLLEALGWDPAESDMLAERTGLPVNEVAAALLELELAGWAERQIDGRYARVRA